MSTPSGYRDEQKIVKLVDALIDGSIDDGDFEILQQAIGEEPDALAIYVDCLNIHSAIRQNFHSHSSAEQDQQEFSIADGHGVRLPSSSTLATKNRWIFYLAAIAASLLVCCAALLYQFYSSEEGTPSDAIANVIPLQVPAELQVDPIENVAVLTRLVNVEWEDGIDDVKLGAPKLGAPLARRELKIKSGLMLVEFYCGAAVIIEGPASFELVAPDRGFAHYGKLRAHVPSRAKGFTIGTESGEVVDLGTEFGIDIGQNGQSEVHVIDGEIDFHHASQADGTPRRLVGGQGIEVANAVKAPKMISSDASLFVNHKQLNARADKQHSGRFRRWLDYHSQLQADPALVADYVFDDAEGWGRTLVNGAQGADETSYGAIVGASWQRGRWPESQALQFDSPSDRVRIKLDGEFDSLSLATWVNIEETVGKRSIALLHPEIDLQRPVRDGKQRFIHWTLNPTPKGAVLHFAESFGIRKEDRNHYGSVSHGVRANDLGAWVHLAIVYDRDALTVSHFRNGELIGLAPIESPRKLSIGLADLCNWPHKQWAANTPFEFRNLNGLMDEFIVLGRSLSGDEVREMYEVGQP